jgi:hypothetical protein
LVEILTASNYFVEEIRKHLAGYNFVGIPETGVTLRWGANPDASPYRYSAKIVMRKRRPVS